MLYCIFALTRSLYLQIKHDRIASFSTWTPLNKTPALLARLFQYDFLFFSWPGEGVWGVGIYTTLPPLDKSLVLPLVFLLMLLLFQNEFREYPALLRHAVSLGRRIQDPLTEFAALCVEEDELLCLRLHPYQVKLSFCNRIWARLLTLQLPKWSTSNLSLQYPFTIQQTGNESTHMYQVEVVILI